MAAYDIGIIGAGLVVNNVTTLILVLINSFKKKSVSGICTAIQLQKKFGAKISFTLFEKNADVGGNWLKNVYPGNRFFL